MKYMVEEQRKEVIKTTGIGYYATQAYVSQRNANLSVNKVFKSFYEDHFKYIDLKLTLFPSSRAEGELYVAVRHITDEAFKKGYGMEYDAKYALHEVLNRLYKYYAVFSKEDLKEKFIDFWYSSNQKKFSDEIIKAMMFLDDKTLKSQVKAMVLNENKIGLGLAGYVEGIGEVPYYITAYRNSTGKGNIVFFIDPIKGEIYKSKSIKDILIRGNKVFDATTGIIIADYSEPENAVFNRDFGLYRCEYNSKCAEYKKKKLSGYAGPSLYLNVQAGDTFINGENKGKTHIRAHLLIMLMVYGYEVMKYAFCLDSSFLVVDHRNCDTFDNSITNLQMISAYTNIKKFPNQNCFDFAKYFIAEYNYYKMQERLIA